MKTLFTRALLHLVLLNAIVLGAEAQSIPHSGLVAWYPFNGNANDESGNGNNGLVFGAALSNDRSGHPNSAYHFDGVDDYINVTNPSVLNFPDGTNFTVSLFYNPGSVVTKTGGFNGILARSYDEGVAGGGGWQIGRDINNLRFEATTPCVNANVTSLVPGTWIHLLQIYDRVNGVIKTYKNTVLVSTTSCPSINQSIISTFDLKMGVERVGVQFSSGEMDDIAIYNRALNDAEIAHLYTGHSAPSDISLSATSILENVPIGTSVGDLTAPDQEGGPITFSLVSGPGSTDNASFTLVSNQLTTAVAIDHESKASYSVRIRATDETDLEFEKQFTISVTDVVNETIPMEGLVAWYPFNGNANDESGNGNNGTANGSTLAVDRLGKDNSTYYFDGSTEIVVPHSAMLNMNGDMSISAWFYDEGPPTLANSHTIVAKRSSADLNTFPYLLANNYQVGIPTDFQKVVFASAGPAGSQYLNSTSDLTNYAWSHIVCTISGSDIKMYLNGSIILSTTVDNSKRVLNTAPLLIGSGGRTDKPAEQFIGNLDDIAIYNRALSADEVSQLYTAFKLVQVITFNNLDEKTFGAPAFSLTATSSSGLGVTYTSSDLTVAAVSGNTVTITGVGTSVITASQAGNDSYETALPVQQTLTVVKATQTITFNALPNIEETDGTITLHATASSGLPVVYSTANNDKLSISVNVASILGPGSVTITAAQPGNSNYLAAASVNQTTCIIPKRPTITLTGLGTDNTVLTSSATSGNQWFKNTVALPGATAQSYTVDAADAKGAYAVNVTVDGCSGVLSDAVVISITEVANVEHGLKLTLYPNPAGSELRIRLTGVGDGEVSEITVYDLAGRLAGSDHMVGTQGGLQLDRYAAGYYLLRVANKSFTRMTKFERQ